MIEGKTSQFKPCVGSHIFLQLKTHILDFFLEPRIKKKAIRLMRDAANSIPWPLTVTSEGDDGQC